MTGPLALGRGGEFDRLRSIYRRLGDLGYALGDDCALIQAERTTIALSIDMSVEGVHFRREWLSFAEIGWRATAAALSDLAAEGARAVGVLVAVGVPGTRAPRAADAVDEAGEIMAGVGEAVAAVGAKVFGGDLVKSPQLIVDVCAVGTAPRPIRRQGARLDDGLWVTGELGGSALALKEFTAGRRPSADLLQRFARPTPRLAAGQWLATQGAHAMIDISDGLTSDAAHLAAASGVALEIQLERVPSVVGADSLVAAASGEEYELLVALPATFGDVQARKFRDLFALPITRIGKVSIGSGVRFTDRGAAVEPPPGYDHFPE